MNTQPDTKDLTDEYLVQLAAQRLFELYRESRASDSYAFKERVRRAMIAVAFEVGVEGENHE